MRGDLEINETKLTNYLGCDVHPGVITEESGIQAGFIGPVNQNADCIVLFDRSLKGTTNLVCGANEVDYHYTGLNMEREFPDAEYVDLAKVVEGGICPCCGKKSLTISRGIEVGNIFQLGTKIHQDHEHDLCGQRRYKQKIQSWVATVSVSDVWQLPFVKHIMMIMVQLANEHCSVAGSHHEP